MKHFYATYAISGAIICFTFSLSAYAAGSATGGSVKPEPKPSTLIETPASIPDKPVPSASIEEKKAKEQIKPVDEAARQERLKRAEAEKIVVPATPAPTPKKWCQDLQDLRQRVECRLKKSSDEMKAELTNIYMPEECRAITRDAPLQQRCVERYSDIRPCWATDYGHERIECVKKSLQLPSHLVHIDTFCAGQDAACRDEYREKIYNLITFRFYDAEERAEEWYEQKKLSLEDTVEFVAFIAEVKIAFNQATKKRERQSIIDTVQKRWDELVAKVRNK